jgi:hypothetical protein
MRGLVFASRDISWSNGSTKPRVSHPWLERDAEIDGLLHAAGFNQAQAQMVYDLAAERVVPVIAGMTAAYEKKMAQGRPEAHFGGADRFASIARQVKA